MGLTREQLERHRMAYFGALAEWKDIQDSLIADVQDCKKMAIENKESGWGRAYIRAVFAYIEANVFVLKQMAYIESRMEGVHLSAAEISFLAEESYQLTEQGEVVTKPNYAIRISSNIRFLWNMYGRVYNVENKLDVSQSGWNSFQEALKVRNRITHPKSFLDIKVTQDDLRHSQRTFEWLQEGFNSLIQLSMDALTLKIEEAKKAMVVSKNPN